MKIPAVAIAAAFGGGILLGHGGWISARACSNTFLWGAPLCCAALFLAGLLFTLRNRLLSGGVTALFFGYALGALACSLTQQPLPFDHISARIAKNEPSLTSPLRWYGRATSEPARLPWGYSFAIALSGVDTSTGRLPLSGSLRIGFTAKEGDPELPAVQAGDEISVLAQAHVPQIYRDAGAFDRREFLARQNISLLATLRSRTLLETISKNGQHSARAWQCCASGSASD